MLVREVMTAEVVTVPVDRTLREAVARMLSAGIGSIIVERDGDPLGIVTETDVLTAGYRSDGPLSAIPVEEVMSHPLVTVAPGATVRAAVERMRTEAVKKLAVVDGIELVGVVTHQDVVHNHPALIREAIHHEERRQETEDDGDRE